MKIKKKNKPKRMYEIEGIRDRRERKPSCKNAVLFFRFFFTTRDSAYQPRAIIINHLWKK